MLLCGTGGHLFPAIALAEQLPDYQIEWLGVPNRLETQLVPQYFPLPFYDNMAGLLLRANLAISRAGAGTLTELAACGTPSILIPFPYAAEDHQTYNAAVFGAAGAALVFRQAELTPQVLETKVLSLLQSPEQLDVMGKSARAIAVPDSAERLATIVRQLLET